jgi:hypothetical protein
VRKFASLSAHNRQEAPFGVWSVREKKISVESNTLTAAARLICLSRTARALSIQTVCSPDSDYPDPDTADGPRSLPGRSAA